MLKKFIKISVLLAAASVSFISCNGNKKADKPVTLLMAEVNPPDSVVGRMDKAFADKVFELSKGTITINLQSSAILGDESQILDIINKPDSFIHLARVSSNLTCYGIENSKLITIPFTFSNADHFWRFANSQTAQKILNEPYEKNIGVKGLFYAEEGFRHIFSVSKINTVKEMEGKKARVSSSKTLQDLMIALGAEPVKVNFSDLYASLKTGKTDIADQPISNYYSNGFHQVAPYIILDGHMLGVVQVIINSATWDSLSKNQQNILLEAGKYASNYCRQVVDEIESNTINRLISEGADITQVKDIKEWQNACSSLISDASKFNPELYQEILNHAK